MVSPQTERHSREFKEEKGFTFELLSDPGNRVAEQYGLVYTYPEDLKRVYLGMDIDLERYNGDDSWRLPMPARYIIDQGRLIRYAVANADHTVRPDPADTLEALKKLARP
jgi:peroxiredoxin